MHQQCSNVEVLVPDRPTKLVFPPVVSPALHDPVHPSGSLTLCWSLQVVTYRALHHVTWIPATLVFMLYTVFGQLIYYQSTPLVIYPTTLVTSLVALTKFFRSQIYHNVGKVRR